MSWVLNTRSRSVSFSKLKPSFRHWNSDAHSTKNESAYTGKVNQKVVPLPNSLSTPILPPCFLIISELI